MTSPTQALAAFGADLAFEDLPEPVVSQATAAILDTFGVSIFGADLPWGRMLIDYARHYGDGGTSSILGTPYRVQAPFAALANGTLAHAFEMDNLRQPSAGVHAGSTLLPSMLAIGEELGCSGKEAIAAFVAGCEVMARIGLAAANTAETLGFHSPGLTGTFGSAVVAGRLLRLTPDQMVNALGIAGSLCSGLLAFSKAGNGGMVKRLHTGRASEGGVLAARLAASGFTGPGVILEGKFGFFDSYTRAPKMERLLHGLGNEWEISKICIKCYACHVTAHTPVQALVELQEEHGFGAADIELVEVATSEKVLSHHNIVEPRDIMAVQYSLPFCLAVAIVRDPTEPQSFLDDPQDDPEIEALAKRVRLSLNQDSLTPHAAWATRLKVTLKTGEQLEIERRDFRGAPTNPMSEQELDGKFRKLTASLGDTQNRLLAALHGLSDVADIRALLRPN